jgi:hypothetical protein
MRGILHLLLVSPVGLWPQAGRPERSLRPASATRAASAALRSDATASSQKMLSYSRAIVPRLGHVFCRLERLFGDAATDRLDRSIGLH